MKVVGYSFVLLWIVTGCGNAEFSGGSDIKRNFQDFEEQDSEERSSDSTPNDFPENIPDAGEEQLQSYCLTLETRDLPAENPRQDAPAGSVLEDVVQHLPQSYRGASFGYGNTYYDSDKITWGHETSHGLSAHLRNYFSQGYRNANAFYILDDKFVLIEEPNIRKSSASSYVPRSLREHRYPTYVTGQSAWDDKPLYIWDEWHAYVLGAMIAVDLAENGYSLDSDDRFRAALEMGVYAVAIAMSVSDRDPNYFADNQNFKNFLGCNLERSFHFYDRGIELQNSGYFLGYDEMFRNESDASDLREFIRDFLGADWAKHYLDI